MTGNAQTIRRVRFLTVIWVAAWSISAFAEPQAQLSVMVKMRDGVGLLTNVYLPDGDGPFPVTLSRVPYGTKSEYIFQPNAGKFFAEHGFAYVSQNVRGRFVSEGLFTAYTESQEIPDAYDSIDWVVNQSWSNGDVGVMGESYYGYTTLMAAVSGHPAIKAISPANITLAALGTGTGGKTGNRGRIFGAMCRDQETIPACSV